MLNNILIIIIIIIIHPFQDEEDVSYDVESNIPIKDTIDFIWN